MSSEELKSAVVRARAGDLDAFGEIVTRFQEMAYGYAYSILGDFHLAEDAAQEAFVEAYHNLSKLAEPAAYPGWFRRIVSRRCARLTRGSRVPTVGLEAAAEVASKAQGPDEASQEREMREAVLEAIRSLPTDQRTATTLFYINGYSQKEIADFLEVPVSAVKSRLVASRRRLKQRMTRMVEDELKKHPLPDGFEQKVLTLAEIMGEPQGKCFVFQYANGVTVTARIDRMIGDKRGIHLLLCGPTKLECHNLPGSYPDSFDSFLLVPSALVNVKRLGEGEGGMAERKSQPESYEVAGIEQPTHRRPALFTPSPAATGPLDIAFADEFGYVRLGAETEEVEYRDKKGKKRTFPIAPTDVYVPKEVIDAYHLKQGDRVACTWRRALGNERFPSVVEIQAVNGKPLRRRQK